MLELVTFIVLSVITLVSAIFVITRRNAVHSAIWLIVTLFSVGGIFLLQHAEFLFAVQIILYVGGIMVLFLFVVMLVDIDVALKQARFARQWPVALVTSRPAARDVWDMRFTTTGTGLTSRRVR